MQIHELSSNTVQSGRRKIDSAYYLKDEDQIYMPAIDAFNESLYYYSALSHESIRWTGAKHRLDRNLQGRFGSDTYAMEELIAELGAAFLCAQLGLPAEPRKDHAPFSVSGFTG